MTKEFFGATLTAVLLASGSANAQSVLYRNDYNGGSTDQMGAALSQLGYKTTTTDSNLQSFNLGDFNAVVYSNESVNQPDGDAAILRDYIANGGRVIYQNWTRTNADLPSLGSAFDGTKNQTIVSLSQFSAGTPSTLALTNRGFGVFSTGLTASIGGTVAGTFGNGSAAIVVGHNGRTIHNGFLTSTLTGSQLYKNQLQSLLASTAAVPEPATWAMMMIGFGVVGYSMRRRTKVRFASVV